MADDQISVKIGADASGLAAGATQAKAEINKIVEALAILQKSVHATAQGMTSELVGAINGLKGNLASVAPQAQRAAAATGVGLYQSLSIVAALAEARMLDPMAVAKWADFFAANVPSNTAPAAQDALREGIAGFAGAIRSIVTMPAEGGRA